MRERILTGKMSKNLGAAKQYREEKLCKFKLACEDLLEEIEPSGSAEPNVRRIKGKIKLLDESYEECQGAHAAFVCSPIFRDKFIRNICIVSGSHLHGALGGIVDPGLGEVHHVCAGVL